MGDPMPDAFETAYAFLRQWEGGDSKPRPGDPNPTSRGITQAAWDGYATRNHARLVPVYDLTEDEVAGFYRWLWDEAEAALLPDGAAFAYFDSVVNMGQGQAVKLLQRAMGIGADGVIGPKTRMAMGSVTDERALCIRLTGLRVRFYRDLAARVPDKARFLGGWLNRVSALQKALGVA